MSANPARMSAVWRNGLPSGIPARPIRASEMSVSMPAGAMKPRSSASHDSLLAPSGIGPSAGERCAVASQSRASRVRPSIAETHPASNARAACAARVRRRGRTSRASERGSRCDPTGAAGTRSRPDEPRHEIHVPGACAYSTARSGSPCSAHQTAARADTSAAAPGSRASSSSRSSSWKQAVVAVRGALPIEGDHEQVLPFELPQPCQRPRRPDGSIAEGSAHGFQHGRPEQPALRLGIEWVDQLRPHVVRDGGLRASKLAHRSVRDPRRCCRVQPEEGGRRPTLRAVQQGGDLVGRDLHVHGRRHRLGALRIQRQVPAPSSSR